MERRWRTVVLIARKDLAIERRAGVFVAQVLPFVLVTMLLFAFALDASPVLERVAPGLIWLAALFSLLMLVQRSFGVESDDGALDALRTVGVDPAAVYFGKALALAVQLLVLVSLTVFAAIVLYGVSIRWSGVVLLVATVISATSGLATVGTLYGGLTAGRSGRETLLPLLVLPVVAPVLIGATRAVESALGTDGVALEEGWPWLGLLTVIAIAFGVGGALAFGPLIDDSN